MVVTVKGKHDAWSGPTSDTQMWQSADRETLLYISCDTDTGCSSKRLNTTLIHDDHASIGERERSEKTEAKKS